ncbi:hypothetical protein GCM10023178_19730 [Actinomadura luteofluorescens]
MACLATFPRTVPGRSRSATADPGKHRTIPAPPGRPAPSTTRSVRKWTGVGLAAAGGFQGWNPAGRSPEPLGRAWRLDAEWNRKGDPLGHADIGVTATVRGVSLTLCEQFIPDFAMNENLIANARVQQRLQILNALN